MNGGREHILRRVRVAVSTPAPRLYERDGVKPGTPWYPMVGEGFEMLRQRFAEELAALKAELLVAADSLEAGTKIRELMVQCGFKKVVAQDAPEIRVALEGVPVEWLGTDTAGGSALKDFELGITGCDALVAQTGSVVLSAKSAGGRAISVLPPNHLVVARGEQLVAELKDALRLVKEKYGEWLPSFVGVISGPSRTSDIEKTLVMGAHGPRRLWVMLIG